MKYSSLGAMSAPMMRWIPPTSGRYWSQIRLRQGSSWLVEVLMMSDAEPVLPGDLTPGVDHHQLGVVVGQQEVLHLQHAADADAAGEVVAEVGVDGTGCGVDRTEAAAVRAVELGEPTADVERGVGRRQGVGRVVGVARKTEAGYRGAGREVQAGHLAHADAAHGVERAGDEQLGAIRSRFDRVDRSVEAGPEGGVELAGVPAVGDQATLVEHRAVGGRDRREGASDEDPVADHFDVPDVTVADDWRVRARSAGNQLGMTRYGLARADGRDGGRRRLCQQRHAQHR